MNSDGSNPWRGINKPAVGFSVLLVDGDHPHAFFWGKDTQGTCLLLLEISKENGEFLGKKNVDLKGVKTDIRVNPTTGEYFFILCLQNREDADIFYSLCSDLVDRTRDVSGQRAALDILHNRFKRWKTFLSKKKSHLLSIQEIRGLFAELEFLRNCLGQVNPQLPLIEGWQGPLDGPHDFVLGDLAVEVKSVTGSQKDSVRITSENQLSTHLDKLFLHVFFLAEFYDCKKGFSLNEMVKKVREAIQDSDYRDLFDSRLYETGYIELKEYDGPCYTVTHEKTYEVLDGFPRITPESLTEGLANVSYDLNLNTLEGYVCEFPLDGGDK